jgi:hypothetical protein
MDFADKFGANLVPSEIALEKANDGLSEVTRLYLERNIADATDSMDEVLRLLAEVEDLSIQARNNALRWVFIIEWLTVMGTFLLSGVVLYSLLIKRRAYREMGVTRINR